MAKNKQEEIEYITNAYTFRINQVVLSESMDEDLKDYTIHKLAEDLAHEISLIEEHYNNVN